MNFGTERCVRIASLDIPYSYSRQRHPLLTHQVGCNTCNLELEAFNLAQHKASVTHRQAQRIKTLLRKSCITYTEIADRLGITRERVRQIAGRFGCEPGRVRQKLCAIQTSVSQPLPSMIEAIGKLAATHGLRCEPVKKFRHGFRWRYSTCQMVIAGYRCGIYHVWSSNTNSSLLRLFRPQGRSMPDFGIYLWQDSAFIIPRERLQTIKRQTMFVFGRERQKSGTRSAQHDWPQFWNAWYLLKSGFPTLAEKRGGTGLGPSAAPGETDGRNIA